MSRPVFSAAQSRERDRYTIEVLGIPSLLLMEHAAQGLCGLADKSKKTVICCGPGNNGQDGMAMARILDLQGVDVCCVILSEKGLGQQYEMVKALDIPVFEGLEEAADAIGQADFLVDGLFGSGLSRNVEGEWAQLIGLMNGSGLPILSIDVPSGLDSTTGEVMGVAVQADVTGCLDAMKSGLLLREGPGLSGKVHVVPIGIPDWVPVEATAWLLGPEDAGRLLPERDPCGHKGVFGRGLVAGGSEWMTGAPCFTAKACFRSGIGLLFMAVPEKVRGIVQGLVPEAVQADWRTAAECAGSCDVVMAGNGMGRSEETRAFVKSLLEKDVPLVIDADGLDGIRLMHREAPTVLTPHLGEFARMSGKDATEIAADPMRAAKEFTLEHEDVVLVLKSSMTCIAQNGVVYVWHHPDSALGKGGSGDVLAGIIGGLLGQTADPLDSALCGVAALGMAGMLAENPMSSTPQSLIDSLGSVWNQMKKETA